MTKSLRAADLGYTWPDRLPDGATWTSTKGGAVILFHNSAVEVHGDRWLVKDGNSMLVREDREWLGLTPPDFGDRPWQECILIKGQEPPEMPPCPPGDGWIEWRGGECPVPAGSSFELQTRDGSTASGEGEVRWRHLNLESDIIRYRVHQPKYRPYSDNELMALYTSSAALVRNDQQGGGRVDSWARINGVMHVGISGDPTKWSAEGLRLYWQHRGGRPCGVEVSQ